MIAGDRFASARLIADAVLYEGYVLYPYRASAAKNQMRWQFGVLAPPAYARASGTERSTVRTEVIVDPGDQPLLTVRIRCLQVQRRDVDATTPDLVAWDEAVEHEINVASLALLPICSAAVEHEFVLEAGSTEEPVRNGDGATVGWVRRRRERVGGLVSIRTRQADGDAALLHVTITVENTTDWNEHHAGRDVAMRRSLIAVHTLLAVDDGSLVSLLEPAPAAWQAVAGCVNDGTFPVLIGTATASDVMLSSPIILYDCPAVAPESAGEFCDSTEIDEILALRVMTLTADEKAQARATDPRAAAIIDRCDGMAAEGMSRLHGAIRSLRPLDPEPDPQPEPWWDPGQDSSFDPFTDTMQIGDVLIGSGTRVRLSPSRRADAHDLFYAGRHATVKGVFNDVDGRQHVAVVLDDDPASDMLEWQGRFLYFHPDEIEVLA